MSVHDKNLCRVRTITAFIHLNHNQDEWLAVLSAAKAECEKLAHALQKIGYTVQSLRLVSNPFGEYLNTQNTETAQNDLHKLTQILNQINANSTMRLRFAIGEAQNAHEIALLPELIRDFGDLCNACVNIQLDDNGFLDNETLAQSVQAIQRIAQITPQGQGNFNFTVNFNCQSFIPYFPASYHRNERGNVLILGLETPDLLVAALQDLPHSHENHATFLQHAYQAMRHALQYHIDPIVQAVQQTPLSDGWQFIGLDTSAAPSKNCASMVDVYRLLGVPYFGAAGTVEISALLTKVFKNVQNVAQVGFSGLMLAVTEDTGLALATQNQEFDIHGLLTFSSVCGIGLDTVPIAGNTDANKIAAIMRDTGTMAFRLNKPLTVRLFPVPNLQAGEMTQFNSDDLCNCAILAVP
ncbi:MAG: DUF711 family protein [Alysiella sp.]|uniref:DUF711 family protein n=1 Tax=Alysiella sp. TaxID=1872483 RepID=UPI0026DBF97B|nr:DUF711 family protein [Alysiella sp.]MDO4434019.1 DUF711 family protein [Alysiella sp.]